MAPHLGGKRQLGYHYLQPRPWGTNPMSEQILGQGRLAPEAKTIHLNRARRTAVLKALADPRRFELLEKIAKARCPLGCAQARATLPISAATLSHHVKELEAAGLIEVQREGKFRFLSLRPGVLRSLAGTLSELDLPSFPSR
jgi:ArsR family transcriptional regulator, arsenate/arsenite/antimonite-responsive transcriptional repressor